MYNVKFIMYRQNDAGLTPLHLALVTKDEEKILKLIELGANLYIQV